MALRIEDYGLIGDCETAALVGRDGSVDWLCWPRFDSGACFAALLGDASNGRWLIAPQEEPTKVSRRYLPECLILETSFETEKGRVSITDFMPPRGAASHLVRLVKGLKGRVEMRAELVLRFDYGSIVPWVTSGEGATWRAVAGPDLVALRTPVPTHGENLTTVAEFSVRAGETVPFVLTYGPSNAPPPEALDPVAALRRTREFWRRWARSCRVDGPYASLMRRSLLTLKALTYAPTGGLVAAPTTSLPERFGAERNWDYRYCWVRDATLSLLALMNAGYLDEAKAWTEWLHRSVAGSPGDMQIMYGLAGERRLPEWEVDWLAGYEGSRPVRVGNAAYRQLQIDVYGELMDAFHHARAAGLADAGIWDVQRQIMAQVAKVWRKPDRGIWEVRGPPRHFTFSKVMAWVAADRAVKGVEGHGLSGPVEAWRALREEIGEEIQRRAFNPRTGGFQRAYDDPGADASLLLLAELGFVSADDPRFAATVAAVERELIAADGLVLRYDSDRADDGLSPGEGAFLVCSFWLANAYVLLGRQADARRLFERMVGFCNDLGLLSEEFDTRQARQAGNFPQALSHVGLLSTAFNLTHRLKPSLQRSDGEARTSERLSHPRA
jgi:GH15 family glucan-1,4-alpha-glucosidase